jgi:hypothetical protein
MESETDIDEGKMERERERERERGFCQGTLTKEEGSVQWNSRGARYLTGENLKVVWAEFSTLS